MISAKEALFLVKAQFPREQLVQFRAVMKIIQTHVMKTMTWTGPTPIEIPFRDMPNETRLLVMAVLTKKKWNVNFNLMSLPPTLQGATPEPHHWIVSITPPWDAYTDLSFVEQMARETESPIDVDVLQ